jgi:hypothetical protein
MSDACRFTLIVCLASTASFAQIPTKDVAMVPLGADCPVGVRAMLTKGGNLLPAQRLQVTLTQWPPFGIVASRITVHGAPIAERPEQSAIAESLDLKRIVDYPRSPATTQAETPAGQGPLAELNDILVRHSQSSSYAVRPTQDGMPGSQALLPSIPSIWNP